MKFNPDDFRVREGDEVKLRKWPTTVKPAYKSTEHYRWGARGLQVTRGPCARACIYLNTYETGCLFRHDYNLI